MLFQLGQPQDHQGWADNGSCTAEERLLEQRLPPVVRPPDHRDGTAAQSSLLHEPAEIAPFMFRKANQNTFLSGEELAEMLSKVFNTPLQSFRLLAFFHKIPTQLCVHPTHPHHHGAVIIHKFSQKNQYFFARIAK